MSKKIFGFFLLLCFALSSVSCERVQQKRARRLANRAVKAIKEQQYSAAKSLLNQALSLDPRNAQARILLGHVYKQYNQPVEAIQEYNKAIALDPKNYQAYYGLGDIYFKDDKEKAAKQYEKVVVLRPNHLYAHYQLAMCYADPKNPQYSKAAEQYRKAITIKSSFAPAHVGLAYVHYDQAKKETDPIQQKPHLDRAEKVLKDALKLGIQSPQIYNVLGLVYQIRKDFERAIATFTKARKLKSYSAVIAFSLAATYDAWYEELANQAKEEKDKTLQEQKLAIAAEKRDKAIAAFKEFLQLRSGDPSKRQSAKMKIFKLNLLKEKDLAKKLKKEGKLKSGRRRRRRR